MRVAICDDEIALAKQAKSAVEQAYKSLDLRVDVFSNGKEFLEKNREKPYDLVILDIEMPEIDGIEVAGEIRKREGKTEIVFLTSHIEYALKGYEVQALRYLTKPVSEEKVAEVIGCLLEREQKEKRVLLKQGEDLVSVRLGDVMYLEANNHDICFLTETDTYVCRGKIGDFEGEYKDYGFIRIHRSYLVNLAFVTRIRDKKVQMYDGGWLPLSRVREKRVREALYHYVKEEAL